MTVGAGRSRRRLRNSGVVAPEPLKPGLHEALLTHRLEELLAQLGDATLTPELADLHEAEAADRVSRHLAGVVARAIDRMPEGKRREEAARVASAVVDALQSLADGKDDFTADALAEPAQVLISLLQLRPDGRPPVLERPLTPLL